MRITGPTLLCALVVRMLTADAHAATLRVPADYPTIQQALDATVHGDHVVLAPGRYTEHGLTFPARGIVLRSESGDPTDTVIDGDVPVDDGPGPTLLYVIPNGSRTQRIEGIGFENADFLVIVDFNGAPRELVIRNCHFRASRYASALSLGPGRMIVEDCLFEGNDARADGAAIVSHGRTTVQRCEFRQNSSSYPFGIGGAGGAITQVAAFGGSLLEVFDSTFEGNDAGGVGGAITVIGGDFMVLGSRFLGNSAGSRGGAIALYDVDSPLIENCLLDSNTGPIGAGIFSAGGYSTTIRGNTIVRSGTTAAPGEGIHVDGVTPTYIDRNIIAFGAGPGIRTVNERGGMIRCNVQYGNAGEPVTSLFQENNVAADPLLCGLDSGDYSIAFSSPADPANSPCGQRIGAFPSTCGAIAIERTTWSRIKLGPGLSGSLRTRPLSGR